MENMFISYGSSAEFKFLESYKDEYASFLHREDKQEKVEEGDISSVTKTEIQSLQEEVRWYEKEIRQLKKKKETSEKNRLALSEDIGKGRSIVDSLSVELNNLNRENKELTELLASQSSAHNYYQERYQKLSQYNLLNDAFHIWCSGSFGTINNLRLGTVPNKVVDFQDINAAFGQTALLVHIIASQCSEYTNFEFKNYYIQPLGNHSKIVKVDDKRISFPLFLDQSSFTFFPKKNFNNALAAFMNCIVELGDFAREMDPISSLPYPIDLEENKISDYSFTFGNDDETWTRSLKCMLSNIKWLVAWTAKAF